MRTASVVAVAIVLGVVAGVGFTWAEFNGVEESFALPGEPVVTPGDAPEKSVKPTTRGRVVVINGDDHDFGSMERETEKSHVFILKNEGLEAVKLATGMSTCKCTSFTLAKTTLDPGETTEATVTWKPVSYDLSFHQRAEVKVTNDPERPIVTLTIHGHVVQNLRPEPESLVLNDISNADPITRQVRVYAYYNDKLEIVKHEFDLADLAKFYDVKIEPLPAEELKNSAGAKSGVLVTITILPGLPLGGINQTVRLTTNEDKGAVVALPVIGRVTSDVSLAGDPRYNAETGTLRLGEFSSDEGASAKLRVFVRGPLRKDVRLSLDTVTPSKLLEVKLGEARHLSNATMYDLTVRVPPGAPPVNHLGTPENPAGKILLNTTHPNAPHLQLLVHFAVTP